MLVGVTSLPPSFPPSRTQAFYIIKRQNCLNICNRVYVIKVGLVFSISNFFITKTYLANKWMRKKIPSCSDSALVPLSARYIFSCEDCFSQYVRVCHGVDNLRLDFTKKWNRRDKKFCVYLETQINLIRQQFIFCQQKRGLILLTVSLLNYIKPTLIKIGRSLKINAFLSQVELGSPISKLTLITKQKQKPPQFCRQSKRHKKIGSIIQRVHNATINRFSYKFLPSQYSKQQHCSEQIIQVKK